MVGIEPIGSLEPPKLRLYERIVFALIFFGPLMAILGVGLAASGYAEYHRTGVLVAGIGLVLAGLGIGASYPLSEFKTLLRKGSGGVAYDQMRYLGHLKASAVLLNLLWLLGFVGLTVALLIRAEIIAFTPSRVLTTRLAAFGAVAILANLTHVHYLSLRLPQARERRYPTAPFLLLALAVTALFALFAIALTERPFALTSTLEFDSSDALLFLMAGATFCSIDLIIARPVPNLLSLFKEGNTPGQRDYISKTKSIVLPAVTAFALLFVVLFLLLAVGVGTTGLQSPIQAVVFGILGVGMLASIFFSVRLARSEDVYDLYRLPTPRETRTGNIVLYTSLSIAAIFGVLGAYILIRNTSIGPLGPGRWVDMLSIGLLIALGPYGFYMARRQGRIRKLEERFPDFLRDVAASHRGGLTLTASVQIAAKGEYGELTPEIRKMADQLSWNVPFNEALQQLMERVHTPLIERAITLIVEASRSGGSTTDVLLAAARDAREIKNLENERRQTMGLYSVIIYITFFVFLVVAAVLYGQLVPEIIKASESAARANVEGSSVGINLRTPSRQEYRAFYFLSALVQGVGNGLVGGLFANGRVLAGLRHSFLMVLISYVTFTFVFP
jgi:archaeal flagellar protein FlaJ